MIDIIQNGSRIKEKLWRSLVTNAKINSNIVDSDITKLEAIKSKSKYTIQKQGIDNIIRYLKGMESVLTQNNMLSLKWEYNINTYIPYTEPFELIHIRDFGIDTCNYLELDNTKKLVEIKLDRLANAIAFEFINREIDISDDEIEKQLDNCLITNYDSMDKLEKIYTNKDIYKLAYGLRVSNSKYLIKNKHKLMDYFYTKKFPDDKYRDIVEYSCRYASTYILQNYIDNGIRNKINIIPLINSTHLVAFIANTNKDDMIINNILSNVSVRIFGRRFEFFPEYLII